MTAKQEEPKKVEVTLTGDHTHEGRKYKKGDKIRVTEKQRDWLIKVGKVAK